MELEAARHAEHGLRRVPMEGLENRSEHRANNVPVSGYRSERRDPGHGMPIKSPSGSNPERARSVTSFGVSKQQAPKEAVKAHSGHHPPETDGREKLYEAYNDLHALAQVFSKDFDAPAILVTGHQTDGKSGASLCS